MHKKRIIQFIFFLLFFLNAIMLKLEASITPKISTITIAKLFCEYPGDRVSTVDEIGDMGRDAIVVVPYLIKVLKTDKNVLVRSRVIKALGKIGGRSAVEAVRNVVCDEERIIRENAAEVLGILKDSGSVKSLINILREEASLKVCKKAVWSLGEIKDSTAVKQLCEVLVEWKSNEKPTKKNKIISNSKRNNNSRVDDDIKKQIRLEAVVALGKIGDLNAMDSLIYALEDSYYRVRSESADALVKMGNPVVGPCIKFYDKNKGLVLQEKIMNILAKIGMFGVEQFLMYLIDNDPAVEGNAVEIFIRIGDPVLDKLVLLLKHDNVLIRKKVSDILIKIGEPSVVHLSGFMKNEEKKYKWMAAKILKTIGESAVIPMIFMLEDKSRLNRNIAAGILVKIGEPAIKHLIETLNSDNERIRNVGIPVSIDILKTITGKNYGRNYSNWRRWYGGKR